MAISQGSLAWLYCCALLLGFGLGAVYDILRITRVFLGVHYSRRAVNRLRKLRLPLLAPRRKKRESRALGIVVFFEDLLFCVFVGITLILLFYECNNGKIRYPAFLAAGAGFLLYRGTVGRLVMLFSEVIAFCLETAVRYVFFFLLCPIRFAVSKLHAALTRAVSHAREKRRKKGRFRYTREEFDRSSRNACGLIPEDIPKKDRIKRGKKIVKQQKTVQSDAPDPRLVGNARRGVDRRVRK